MQLSLHLLIITMCSFQHHFVCNKCGKRNLFQFYCLLRSQRACIGRTFYLNDCIITNQTIGTSSKITSFLINKQSAFCNVIDMNYVEYNLLVYLQQIQRQRNCRILLNYFFFLSFSVQVQSTCLQYWYSIFLLSFLC